MATVTCYVLDERDKCNAKATFHILSVVAADWHRCGALLPGLSQHNSHPGVLWIQSGIYANYGLLFNMSCVLTGVYGLAKLCE